MPKSTGQSTGSYKPWFNSECKKAVKARQNAMDKCRINPTSDNINEYKTCPGNARKIIKENKRKSFIYLFGVLHRFQHCTGHITTGSWKGRGNQYI